MEIECGFIQSCLNWNMYCCFSFVAVSHSLNAIYRKSMFNAIEKYVFHFLELAIWFVCLSIFSVFFLVFFCVCILYTTAANFYILFSANFMLIFQSFWLNQKCHTKNYVQFYSFPPKKRRTTKKIWNLYWVWTKMHCIY